MDTEDTLISRLATYEANAMVKYITDGILAVYPTQTQSMEGDNRWRNRLPGDFSKGSDKPLAGGSE